MLVISVTIYRVRSLWTGFTGAPGYTNQFFSNDSIDPAGASQTGAAVRAMFLAMASYLPSVVKINVQPTVDVFALGTGEITGQVTMSTVPPQVSGVASGAYSAPSGAAITWTTDTYVKGRRRKGRTFFVPLGATAYDTDGTLAAGCVTALTNAAAAITGATGTTPVVWHRAVAKVGAEASVITGAIPADRASVLRSRRD